MNKEEFINIIEQNHNYFSNSISQYAHEQFLYKYNLIFTTLCKKIINSNFFEDFLIDLKQKNFKNKQEHILLFSYGLNLINHNLYNKISELSHVRSEYTISHPLNSFLFFDFSSYLISLQEILDGINNRFSIYNFHKIDVELIKITIFFLNNINDYSLNFELATKSSNDSDAKKFIKELNNNSDYLVDFFSKWLVENRRNIQPNKNIECIFRLIQNKQTKLNIIKKISNTHSFFNAYETIESIFKDYNKEIILENIDIVIQILKSWKSTQYRNSYTYFEIGFILHSNLFEKIIEYWISNDLIDDFKNFYEWTIFSGNIYGITYSASEFENLILNKSVLKLIIQDFYKSNISLIQKRYNRGSISIEMINFLNEIRGNYV